MLKALVLLLCISSVLSVVPVAMKCPDGWKWWKRSRGGWCMKVFAGPDGTDTGAEAGCKAAGAVLAGVQNTDESDWMVSTILALKPGSKSVRIGSKRTKKCIDSGLTAECTRLNSFYWTDGSTTGIQGFKWHSGEPNNMGGNQACVHIYTSDGTMDDVVCGIEIDGYVCGKVASFD